MRIGGRRHGHSRLGRDLSDLGARKRHGVRMPRVGDVEGERCARTELGRGNHGNVWIRVIIGHLTSHIAGTGWRWRRGWAAGAARATAATNGDGGTPKQSEPGGDKFPTMKQCGHVWTSLR